MPEHCPHHLHHDKTDDRVSEPPTFWRSLEEHAATPQFLERLHREFPDSASVWNDEPSRRRFMKLMGASIALAGLNGCFRKPTEKIVPYVNPPEAVVPGEPWYFATALALEGFARGALVRSNDGRPTKVEGNFDHPASLGATDVFMQASILQLYDPDRSRIITHNSDPSSWEAFTLELVRSLNENGGEGLRILSGPSSSPTLARQRQALLKRYPSARWHVHNPLDAGNVHRGARMALGSEVDTLYAFDQAKVILSLDADFLGGGPSSVCDARQFIEGRRVRINDGRTQMNRLYVIESSPSITGAMADHRVRLRPGAIRAAAMEILHALQGSAPQSSQLPWLTHIVEDLRASHGASAVIAGRWQSPEVHAIAHTLNSMLENVGKTVSYIDPVIEPLADDATLAALVNDMSAGKVRMLMILGCNPAYDAPVDLAFAASLQKVPLRIHHGLFDDETAAQCQWHIPANHELEQWSDLRSCDGTASIVQPLIAPLYNGRSAHQLLSMLLGEPDKSDYELVRETWKAQGKTTDFETTWRNALNKGIIDGTTAAVKTMSAASPSIPDEATPSVSFEIAFRPDPCIWDGSFANNGWLQELPKPLTKLTWDNVILISPADARKLNLESGRLVELSCDGNAARGPVLILPGHPDNCVTVHLGFGRTRCGTVGTEVGFSAYALRTMANPWVASNAKLTPVDSSHDLAITQRHQNMEGRELIIVRSRQEYLDKPRKPRSLPLSLYSEPNYSTPGTHRWGMSIDNNACTGCNACVIACVAENNIPVVGREQVSWGREMHWLRIDAYYTGEPGSPEGPYFEPVPCMHCEYAPCELVCPVGATTHSAEGINEMTYNRCVGTRYCSNNCPYKVRHFNFLQYSDTTSDSLKLGRNPEVTVRSRGVMEKCNYCIQRINMARIKAKKHDANGEPDRAIETIKAIQTACQQACPTHAISFGDINLAAVEVVKWKAEPGDYSMLEELNTRPRTTYLPRLTNQHVS